MNFRRILSTVRLFRDFIQPPGYINWKKEGGKKDIRDCPRTDRTAVPANFPNFANKSSDVKIPRWIVKVLTSSAILQSPSYLHFSCTRVPFRATIVKRETKTKTRLTGDWGGAKARALVLYIFQGWPRPRQDGKHGEVVSRVENKRYAETIAVLVHGNISRAAFYELRL